jgi:fructokinase
MFSLLSYGEVLVDFLPNTNGVDSYIPLAGGAPANVAVAFSKLGGASYFAGGISKDNFGAMLLQQLNTQNVNTAYVNIVENANTAIVLVSLDQTGERSFNFYRHDTADMQYDTTHINKIEWQGIDIFHYCSNTLTENNMYINTLYAIKSAKENNLLVSFDVNLRQQLWSDLHLLPTRVEAVLKESHIVKLSKDEALYLVDIQQCSLQEYTHYLLKLGVTLVIITDGFNEIQVTSNTYATQHSVPEIKAIDTTAAGDSFIASFLFNITKQASASHMNLFDAIKEEKLVSESVIFAAQCGALTCQKKGAFAALPSIEEL